MSTQTYRVGDFNAAKALSDYLNQKYAFATGLRENVHSFEVYITLVHDFPLWETACEAFIAGYRQGKKDGAYG